MENDVEILEFVEDTVVMKLPVPGFQDLVLKDKLISYHLWHAAVAGDGIIYDQNYRHGLALRNLFLDLLKQRSKINPDLSEKFELYTKKLLLGHGNHDDTCKKFIPSFSQLELKELIDQANKSGASINLSSELEKVIFDPDIDVMITQKTPPEGQDIITASCNNLYHNLSLKDIEGFQAEYPENSTLLKENENLVEKVWRAGNTEKGIPAGLYANYLKKIVEHLEKAASFSSEDQKKHLLILKRFLEEGDPSLFDEYNVHWVKSNPEVDTINGFIESYLDAMGTKCAFEAMVFFKDKKLSEITNKIAQQAQHLENNAPWQNQYKKDWTKIPVANSINLLIGSGDAGPIPMLGVNLPNKQKIREEHGSKNILLSNVTMSTQKAFAPIAMKEFTSSEEEKELMLRYLSIRNPIMITLHEVVGHGSGKVNPTLKRDPKDYLKEYYSTLEEARAELCSLHHVWDPKLREIGVIPDEDCCKSAYLGYALGDITMLRRFEHQDQIQSDHMRAAHLIIQYVKDKTNSIEFFKKNNKTYLRINDYQKMRKGVAELLAELMRIKAEGDYDAIKALVDKYAIKFDLSLRDEVVRRSKEINYPNYFAYVMPEPKLVKDGSGKVSDVVLEYPKSLLEQGYRWQELSN